MSKDILDSPFFNTPGATANTPVPSDVVLIPLEQFPRFISTKETGDKVFLVQNGKSHWIMNPEAFAAVGGSYGLVHQIEKENYAQLDHTGENITVENAPGYILESPAPVEEKIEVEFKTYEEPAPVILEGVSVDSAPGAEPVKGFTSIIIPAYMASYALFHNTGHCIGSVHEHTDKAKTPYEIILVLNGKTGIGFSNLEETLCDKVIEVPENLGYGGGMNKGIRVAKGEYIVLLSNDVLVFDHWLEDFQEALEHKDLVMATPMYGMPYARSRESMKIRDKYISKHTDIEFNDFRDFSCVATRKSLFNEIGLFDEKFFAYKEDLDIMNRMDEVGKTYASTGPVGNALINTFHIIGATSVDMSPEQLHKKEGEEHYNGKYGQTKV